MRKFITNSKERLPFLMVIELLITIGMIIDHNLYAALGWGFLLITNIGVYTEYLESKKQNGNNNKSN